MNKKILSMGLATMVAMSIGFAAYGCNGTGPEPGPGPDPEPQESTLTIDDVTVLYQEHVSVEPKFSNEEDRGAITYKFEGENIRFQGNIVTGLVGNTTTSVTAECGELSTTFTVTVNFENIFGKNAYTEEFDDVFTAVDDGVFEKTSAEYGEAYIYNDGEALAGSKYLLTGRLELKDPQEGAFASVIVKESKTKAVRYLMAFEGEDKYALYSETLNGEAYENRAKVRSLEGDRLDFGVLVQEGKVYFYCGEVFVSKSEAVSGNVHVGIGGEKGKITASRMRAYTGDEDARIGEYLDLTKIVFGAHAFGGGNDDKNIFVEAEDKPGFYVKSGTAYGQTFYYHEGLPVAGEAYTIEFDLTCDNPTTSLGQATFLLHKDDNNMVRFALEHRNGEQKWHVFTDIKREGSFGNWKELKVIEGDSVTLKVKIVFDHGTCALFINNEQVGVVEETTLDQTHIGFGGEQCRITIGNITAKLEADPITKS